MSVDSSARGRSAMEGDDRELRSKRRRRRRTSSPIMEHGRTQSWTVSRSLLGLSREC